MVLQNLGEGCDCVGLARVVPRLGALGPTNTARNVFLGTNPSVKLISDKVFARTETATQTQSNVPKYKVSE